MEEHIFWKGKTALLFLILLKIRQEWARKTKSLRGRWENYFPNLNLEAVRPAPGSRGHGSLCVTVAEIPQPLGKEQA